MNNILLWPGITASPYEFLGLHPALCRRLSYYTGHTDNLELRLGQHKTGDGGGYTSTRQPVDMVFLQEHATREEALTSEQQIKGWSRKKKEALMRGDWDEISRLARCRAKLTMCCASALRQAQGERCGVRLRLYKYRSS